MSKIKTIIESLSLDVALAALCGLVFASEIVQQPMPWWWFLGLFSGVWLIYSLDHFADACFLPGRSRNPRHLFFLRNKKTLGITLVIVGSQTVILIVVFASRRLFIAGFGLFLLSALHLILVSHTKFKNRWYVQKEVMVALIYTLGIWFGPIVQKNQIPDWSVIIIMLVFALTAWQESALIALLEKNLDKKQQIRSVARDLGEKMTLRLLLVNGLVLILVGLFMLVFRSSHYAAWLIIIVMNFVLLLLLYYRKTLYNNNYYHLVGELVFCLPVLLVLA